VEPDPVVSREPVAADARRAADDTSLVEQALAGDRDAFGVLVERHQDRLFNALWRLLGCAEDARDAVQEAFVQAFMKLGGFRGDSQFATWLYRIGVNQALAAHRRRRATASLERARAESGFEPADGASGPSHQAAQREEVARVQQALQELDEAHRCVLVLREIEGHSYESIAEILAVPLGTVRSRIFRARLQLRDHLAAASD